MPDTVAENRTRMVRVCPIDFVFPGQEVENGKPTRASGMVGTGFKRSDLRLKRPDIVRIAREA